MRLRVTAVGLTLAVGVALAGGATGAAQAAGMQRYVSPGGSNNATCLQANPCQTVTAGVAAAAPGDTINLAAGTYTEQVTITKSVTLKGAGKAQSTIKAPATFVLDAFGQSNIVEIGGGAMVTLTRLTVAGPVPLGGCGIDTHSIAYGIFVVGDATLDMSNAAVNDIFNGPFNGPVSGCQQGVAVRLGSNFLGQVAHGSLTNVSINRYQKGGIVVDGPGTTATIVNDSVINLPETVIASNGIQISRGATATVTNNTISGNECNNPAPVCGGDLFSSEAWSAGILTFQAGRTTFSANRATANDIGIALDVDPAGDIVKDNTATNNRYAGIAVFGGQNYLIRDNSLGRNGEYGLLLATDGTGVSNSNILDNSAFGNHSKDMYADVNSLQNTARSNDCATAVPNLAFWGCDGNGGRF
jgi:parallel beta-helix repeat protein